MYTARKKASESSEETLQQKTKKQNGNCKNASIEHSCRKGYFEFSVEKRAWSRICVHMLSSYDVYKQSVAPCNRSKYMYTSAVWQGVEQ